MRNIEPPRQRHRTTRGARVYFLRATDRFANSAILV